MHLVLSDSAETKLKLDSALSETKLNSILLSLETKRNYPGVKKSNGSRIRTRIRIPIPGIPNTAKSGFKKWLTLAPPVSESASPPSLLRMSSRLVLATLQQSSQSYFSSRSSSSSSVVVPFPLFLWFKAKTTALKPSFSLSSARKSICWARIDQKFVVRR